MTKVKNSVVRLCCYSYSDYCLKATALKCYLPQAFVGRGGWNVFSTDCENSRLRGCYLTSWRIKLVIIR